MNYMHEQVVIIAWESNQHFFPFLFTLIIISYSLFFCIIWSLINHVSYHAHGQGIINCSSLISVSFHSVDTPMYLFSAQVSL